METKNLLAENEKGVVLPIGMMFLGILAIIGIAVIVVVTTDLKIGSNFKTSVKAFTDAESGINFAVQSIENGLQGDTFTLPVNIGDSVELSGFTTPEGFAFVLGDLTKDGANSYSFTSTGSSGDTANVVISATGRESLAITLGIFGDDLIDMKASSTVYSYNSSSDTPPTPSNTTHQADIGSNGEVSVKMGTIVDGRILLGDDGAGNEAVYTHTGTPIVRGTGDVKRIDPDPLGIVGGEHAAEDYAANNDNASVGIGTSLNLSGTLTLPPGDYYFTDITLKNGATLDIQATGDQQVNIWLTGPMEAKNGSAINISGSPVNFTLFSNSTESIILKHGTDFEGLIYAPYAKVELKNSGTLYGAAWAKEIETKNSAIIYYDTALKNKYNAIGFEIVMWKEEI